MNILLLLQSVLAFSIGIVSLYFVYVIVRWYLYKMIKIANENEAFAIFKAGIILASANLMSSVTGPGINVIRFLNQENIAMKSVLLSLGYVGLFVIIGMLFSFLVIAGGIIVLFQLTHVNEWQELKNNNLKTALISAALIIGLSLIMREQVGMVCEMFIPYPQVMQVN